MYIYECLYVYAYHIVASGKVRYRVFLATGSKNPPKGAKVSLFSEAHRWRHQGVKVVLSSRKTGTKLRTFGRGMEKKFLS